jgi:hypothetical protein
VDARLPGADGQLQPLKEILGGLVGPLREHASDLGCLAELDGIEDLLLRGGGAGRQRAAHEIAGMGALLRELIGVTGLSPAAGSLAGRAARSPDSSPPGVAP